MFARAYIMSLKLAVLFYIFVVAAGGNTNRDGRIIGGSEAKPHQFPHMVSLDHEELLHFCGGSILNERWIITAGHCLTYVKKKTFRIKAGKHSIGTVEDSEQVVQVSKRLNHKKYPGGYAVAPHDIALLKLEKPLIFNEYVQPIALPEQGINVTGNVLFSGWGYVADKKLPDKLQWAEFNVIDLETCQREDIALGGSPSAVTDEMLCTGPSPNGVYACNLDSGSPLIKQEKDKTYLAGVFSWLANPCAGRGERAPSVFTKVSSYVDWIKHIMDNN